MSHSADGNWRNFAYYGGHLGEDTATIDTTSDTTPTNYMLPKVDDPGYATLADQVQTMSPPIYYNPKTVTSASTAAAPMSNSALVWLGLATVGLGIYLYTKNKRR